MPGPARPQPDDAQVRSAIAAWSLFACTVPTDRTLDGWGVDEYWLRESAEVLRAAVKVGETR